MVCYAEPMVVIHGMLCWASGCESWGIMLCESLWITRVMLIHWLWMLCWPTSFQSWCAMLSQWLWIIVCYAEPVVVNHGVLCLAGDCESLCGMHSNWFWIIVWYVELSGCESCCAILSRVVVVHHDSQPLVQHSTPWFTTTDSAYLTMTHNLWNIITIHGSKPLAQLK
jgi:hypothetical protein